MKNINYVPYLFFIVGIGLSFSLDLSAKSQAMDSELTRDFYELFTEIVSNNFMVCLIIISGCITLCISSLLTLLYNGILFGYCLQYTYTEQLEHLFLSYSLVECMCFILSAQVSIYLTRAGILYVRSTKIPSEIGRGLLKKTILIILAIPIAALIEVYVCLNSF